MLNLASAILDHIPLPPLPSYLVHYEAGASPLSQTHQVVTALASYLAVVFGLRHIMRDQPPLKLTTLFQLHNIILSAGSALLLALMVEEVFPIYWNHGLFHAMCSNNAWTTVRLNLFS
jgi:fatty acid elongase 3